MAALAELFNRQRRQPIQMGRLREVARAACVACLRHEGGGSPVLGRLEAVEISIVSDRVIAQVHRRFLHVGGPTDVITFEHGEIVVSATTAARQAQTENESLERELARYIIHGLLHLNGHLDDTPAVAARMWRAQESVLQSLWPEDQNEA